MFAIGSWTRLLRLLGTLQGMPESLRAPAFVRHHQTGAGFDSQTDRIMMMMIEILKRMVHNLIRTMYD